jgi:hypothetical protein
MTGFPRRIARSRAASPGERSKGRTAMSARQPWTDIGGDLEARYDGHRYAHIRVKGESAHTAFFISRGALKIALKLFTPPPVCE